MSQAFKVVPTTEDWMSARQIDNEIVCPVCHVKIFKTDVDAHTTWHQQIASIFALLAG